MTIKFSGHSTVKDGQLLTPAQADAISIVMVNDLNQVMAQISDLGTDGASFTINRTSIMISQNVSPSGRTGWRRVSDHGYHPGDQAGPWHRKIWGGEEGSS